MERPEAIIENSADPSQIAVRDRDRPECAVDRIGRRLDEGFERSAIHLERTLKREYRRQTRILLVTALCSILAVAAIAFGAAAV